MRQLQSLIWKEWREAQLFLWVAWGLFIGLPIIGGLEGKFVDTNRSEFVASPWVYLLGPLLAIVIGVAVTCRDLQPKLEDFWQSRPMGGTRLFGVKYIVAAAVVLLACGVPLLIEIGLGSKNAVRPGVLWTAFLWLASFSIAFAAGCLLRRSAYAASLAIVGLLLLLFVPVVVPPLSGFNVSQIDEWTFGSNVSQRTDGRKLLFAVGMLSVSFTGLAIGLMAVRRHWYVESSKPLIYSTLAATFLILLVSASYQLGTNLPVLQHVAMPEGETVLMIRDKGEKHTAYSYRYETVPYQRELRRTYFARTVSVEQTGITVSPARHDSGFDPYVETSRSVRSARSPDVSYNLANSTFDDKTTTILTVTAAKGLSSGAPSGSIVLWREPTRAMWGAYVYASGNRLYVGGKRTVVFDISNPLHPIKLIDEPVATRWVGTTSNDATLVLPLPEAPGLDRFEKLKFLFHVYPIIWGAMSADLTVWCRVAKNYESPELSMYHLRSLDDRNAIFDRLAVYKPTLVQSFIGMSYFGRMTIRDNLLYACGSFNQVVVFDLSGPRPLRLVAHFVANGSIADCVPLPDGRALVGGSELWLLGPPPRH